MNDLLDENNQPLPFINEGVVASLSSFPPLSSNTSTVMESSSSMPETMNLLNCLRRFNNGVQAFAIVEGLRFEQVGAELCFHIIIVFKLVGFTVFFQLGFAICIEYFVVSPTYQLGHAVSIFVIFLVVHLGLIAYNL
jgi:hypothetical protein